MRKIPCHFILLKPEIHYEATRVKNRFHFNYSHLSPVIHWNGGTQIVKIKIDIFRVTNILEETTLQES